MSKGVGSLEGLNNVCIIKSLKGETNYAKIRNKEN